MTPKIVTQLDEAARLSTEWAELVHSLGAGYFDSPDWTLAWWESFGTADRAQIAIWYDATGSLDALLLLCQGEEVLKVGLPWKFRVWTTGFAELERDRRALLCRADRAEDVISWICEFGSRHPLLLCDLDPDLGLSVLGDIGTRFRRRTCPQVTLPPDGSPLPVSKNFADKLQYYRRSLERNGVEIRRLKCGEVSEAVLVRLFELHALRRAWAGKNGSVNFGVQLLPMFLRLCELGGTKHGPLAVVAARGQVVVGVLLGILWGNTFTFYQHGWDPDWRSYSLGTVMVAEAIALARDSGVRTFDFMSGQDPYKYRFGAVDRVDETRLVPGGAKGMVLSWKIRAAEWRAQSNRGANVTAQIA